MRAIFEDRCISITLSRAGQGPSVCITHSSRQTKAWNSAPTPPYSLRLPGSNTANEAGYPAFEMASSREPGLQLLRQFVPKRLACVQPSKTGVPARLYAERGHSHCRIYLPSGRRTFANSDATSERSRYSPKENC